MSNTALVENVYYTCSQYNPLPTEVPANSDDKLIFPLVKDADNYQVAVAKADIPIGSIPLTQTNIPLKEYEITLRQGTTEASAYVRQINAKNGNYLWNCTPNCLITQYDYSGTSGTLSPSSQAQDFSAYVPFVSDFAVDDYTNVYLAGSLTQNGVNNLFYIINFVSGNVLATLDFFQIVGMDLDYGNQLYVANEAPTGTAIEIFTNTNSATQVILTPIATIINGFDGNPLSAIRTISCDTTLFVGYELNKFSLYSCDTFQALNGFTEAGIVALGTASAVLNKGTGTFMIVDNGVSPDLFVGTKANTYAYDMISNTEFIASDPTFACLSGTKFAFGNDKMSFIGNDNYLYQTNYSNGQSSGTPQNLSSLTQLYDQIASYPTRDNLVVQEASTRGLYGLGLDNLGNYNPFSILGDVFSVSSTALESFDYQNSTNKILAIANNEKLYISTVPVYPKNFLTGNFTGTVGQTNNLQLVGTGWNTSQTLQVSTVSTISSFTPTNQNFMDWFCSPFSGLIVASGVNVGGDYFIGTYNSSGVEQNFYTTAEQYNNICALGINGLVAMSNNQGIIHIRAENGAGALLSQINLPLVPSAQLIGIAGCYVLAGNQNILVATYGTNFYLYSVNTAGTIATLNFSTDQFIPAGQITPEWLFQATFNSQSSSGTGANFPKLFLTTSGSKANPDYTSAQALVQVAFLGGASFTGIDFANTVILTDNQLLPNQPGNSLTADIHMEEVYLGMGVYESQGYINFNGVVQVWNVPTATKTSTFNMPTGNSYIGFNYYNIDGAFGFSQITTTGATSFQSVAVSKRNPNNIYLVDISGNSWKGTLSGLNLALTSLTSITGSPYTSISMTPEANLYNTALYEYTISNQTQLGTKNYGTTFISSISKNDVSLQFIVGKENVGVDYFASSNFQLINSSNLDTTNLIYTKNGEDVFAGNVPIYFMQVLLDAINSAFAEAYKRLKALGGTLAEQPTLSLNVEDGLCSLTYSSDYATAGNGILFNPALNQLVSFNSGIDTIDINQYLLVLNTSGSITQYNKSIYQFNQLSKLLFQSQTIYVSGSFFGVNSQSQIITDISVPIDSFINNVGQIIQFQPNFLRVYQLSSNSSIDRIQMTLLYQYTDGTQYPLLLNSKRGWSVLLNFVRKF